MRKVVEVTASHTELEFFATRAVNVFNAMFNMGTTKNITEAQLFISSPYLVRISYDQ